MELQLFEFDSDGRLSDDPAQRAAMRAHVLRFAGFVKETGALPVAMPDGLRTIAALLASQAAQLWAPEDMPPTVTAFVAAYRLSDDELSSRMEAARAESEAQAERARALRPPSYGDAESAALGRLPERAVLFALRTRLPDPAAVRADEVILLPDDAPIPLEEALRRIADLPKPLDVSAEARGAHMVVDARPGELAEWQFAHEAQRGMVDDLSEAARELNAPEAVLLRGAGDTLLLPRDAFAAWLLIYGGGGGGYRGDRAGPEDARVAAFVLDLGPWR